MELEEQSAVSLQEKRIFTEYPVPRAAAAMILPTIVSQIIFVIYNLADTWYVGLTENADMVAAISLCLPVYTLLSAVSNLFGIGGASVIARALGNRNPRQARQAVAVSVWGAVGVAVVYAVVLLLLRRPLLMLIGGDSGDIGYAVTYVTWTIVIGGIPTILATTLGHLVRSAGMAKKASFGMILGAVLNIGLDPLLMFVLLPPGNEVLGAAMATAISNGVALCYFLLLLWRNRQGSIFTLHPAMLRHGGKALREIFFCGLPGFCMVALAMLSNCFLNSMLATMGSEAVAGLGIVRKIDQLAYAVNQGVTQGMLPLVAYNYAIGNHKRMWSITGFCAACSEIFSLLCMAVSLLFAPQLVSVFIRDTATVAFGASFLRVLCLAIPIYTVTFVVIALLQAMGKSGPPFLLSILHKGTLDIALLFLIGRLFGMEQILWATPISEAVALMAALVMLVFLFKKMKRGTSAKGETT